MGNCGNRPSLTRIQGQGGSAYLNETPMKFLIAIYCDNSAFKGKDCGREQARILQIVNDRVDVESKCDLIRRYHDDPTLLFDINGNRVDLFFRAKRHRSSFEFNCKFAARCLSGCDRGH